MSFSHQPQNEYQDFGFVSEKQNNESEKNDYNDYGFKPEKEKTGKFGSLLYGIGEGILGIPALIQYGANEWSKGIEEALGDKSNIPFEEENPLLHILSEFPESEDEASRRIRVGASGVTLGALGGIPGIVAGLVGSQAGQTIREVYGKEGKFEKFGWGEGAAITADILTGSAAGILTSVARNGSRAAVNQIPGIFREGQNSLERASIKHVIQGEKNALQNIVDSFGSSQIQGFERQAAALSPNRYNELVQSNVAGLQRHADQMFRLNTLNIISPLQTTPEQGGRAIQQAANTIFQDSVITAERTAYNAAREAAQDLSGQAPRALEQAIALRNSLTTTNPSAEQSPVVQYLNTLISDLQIVHPERTIPASTIIGENGLPLVPSRIIPQSTTAAAQPANNLIDLVQKGNYAINYGSEAREQSHRLIPIINTLRQETGAVLNRNPQAANLYLRANQLHATNAETWGTNFIKTVRFTENPENIISATAKASNMRNLKLAIPDPTIQGVTERLVVDKITQNGSVKSNLQTVNNISPELSLNAQNASRELINIKDPLTTAGARVQIRNEILKDAAQSVNTGKRPEKILQLMETPRGYDVVRESLSASPQGREIFQSMERLFIEDIFSSVVDNSGRLNFSKATNIFKNRDVRQVVERIGGPGMVQRFQQLQTLAQNFERNVALYSNPQTQGILKSLFKNVKDAGIVGAVMHALHVPWPVIIGLGIGKATLGTSKVGYNVLQRQILSNPRAFAILESISRASTPQQLAIQLPRLIEEMRKNHDSR